MKKLLIAASTIGILAVLSACSQQTKDKASETVEAAKTDIAANTSQVAKEAESAAQSAAETTKNAMQTAADTTSEVAKEVGARADAATNPNSAESQVPEEQKYWFYGTLTQKPARFVGLFLMNLSDLCW